jgi:hypothetical protein
VDLEEAAHATFRSGHSADLERSGGPITKHQPIDRGAHRGPCCQGCEEEHDHVSWTDCPYRDMLQPLVGMTVIASITIELDRQGKVVEVDTAKGLRRRAVSTAQPGAAQVGT